MGQQYGIETHPKFRCSRHLASGPDSPLPLFAVHAEHTNAQGRTAADRDSVAESGPTESPAAFGQSSQLHATDGRAFPKHRDRAAGSIRFHRARSREPVAQADRDLGSGGAVTRLHAVTSRCAVLALCVLPVAFHANAQDATATGTLVSDVGANAPIVGNIIVQRVARALCGWENPPAGKSVSCRGTYTEDTPNAYFIWQIPAPHIAPRDYVLEYAPMDVTATAGEDYTASSGSLTVRKGDYKSQRAYIDFIDDSTDEHDETMAYEITIVKTGLSAPDFLAFQITDNDLEPSLSIDNVSVAEDGGPLAFRVSLDAASGKEITVQYTTAEGTATSGADYASASGTLTFAAGDTAATITVDVVDDGIPELDEDMTVTLSNAANAMIGTGLGTGTILDTNSLPDVSVNDERGPEDTVGNLAFIVTLSAAGTSEVTVSYATVDDTATAGSDYTATNGTATFPVGTTAFTIDVPVLPDTVWEPNEDFILNLAMPANALIVDGTATGTIEDDEPQLAIADNDASEGDGFLPLVVTFGGTRGSLDVTVNYVTSGLTATEGDDFTDSPGTLSFAAGVSTATILVPLIDDSVDEVDETFSVELTMPVNATLADATATATIRDNDDAPGLSVDDAMGPEGSAAAFVVSLDGTSAQTIKVDYDTSSGTARESDDFTATGDTLTLAPGASRATISVQLTDDALDEPDETFTLALDSPVGAVIDTGTATGTITDNDDEPTVSVKDATDTEGSDADFVVELSAVSGRDVTVVYATSDGTALGGTDFVAATDTLTITAGTVGGTISVSLTDDPEDEDNETFDLALTSPSNATVLDGSATGTIVDNDDPPMLAVTDADGPEGGEAAFEVSLSATSAREVTVTYGAVDGTAIVGADFEATAGTLTFPPGTRALPVTVPLTNDDIDEVDETFELRLEFPVHATLADGVGAGTIRDGDDPPTLAVTDADGPEGGEAAFEVSLSATSGREVTVTYDAVDGTAIVGADFEATAGTLTFPPGTRALPVTVPLADDDIDEADETFELRLESPVHATLADGVGAGTIRDGDDPPELSLAAAEATEGETAAFPVTLTAASSLEVTVSYATSEGTAKAPDDFAATNGVLTFAPGTVRRMVSVAIADDALDEPEETFELALSMPDNATVSQGTGTGTIVDNDDAPVVSVADAFAAEGGTLAFTVGLSAASSRTVRVSFETADGTAGAADYESIAGELTFATGTTRAMVSVQLLEDDLDEPEETFTLSLSAPVNASVRDAGTAEGRIVDNDGAPRLTVESTTATEGGHANFEVVLVGSTGQAVTVNYATRGLSALEDKDYEAAAGTLTLGMATPGDLVTARTVAVALTDDTLAEPDETFELVLSSPANAALAATGVATGTILDNDAAPTLSVTGASGDEGGDATFTVTMTGETSHTVTVRYATSDGSAVAGADYEPSAGTLTFATGETTRAVAIALTDDAADEPDETFSLELQSSVNATVLTGTATGTIRDNDAAPSLSVADGSGEEGSTVAFEVVLSGATDRAVAVEYATSDGTARAGDDYVAAGATLRFPRGVSVRTVTVRTHEDQVHEPNETFGLMLSSPINASLSSDAAIGRIVDDDGAPTLSIVGAAGTEGAIVRFRVTLAGSGSESATVDYATLDGTASAGADYETAQGTLTFAPGESVGEIPVRLLQDALGEPDESFGMRLSAAANATVTTADATATIFDDDGGIPMLSAEDAAATEGGVLAFAFVLDGPAGSPVTVDYRTVNGTALAGSDYTAVSGTLTLDVGETSGSVEVPTLDDDVKELEENFSLHLSSAANAAPVATLVSDVVMGTILDNDVPPELAVEGGVSVEGELAVFTVALTGAVNDRVTVDFATVAGTARDGEDFLAERGTLTFDAGTAIRVAVSTVDDDLDEPVETLGLSLTAPVNAELPVGSAISTIEDNDEPPALSIANASSGEGEVAGFPVTLSDPSGFEVTVAYSTSDGTAVAGADYEAVAGSLAFAPGETTATVSIPLVQDSLDEPDERFTVSLSSPANATLATATAEGTIIDDDLAVQLAVAGGTGVEGGTVEFAVTLDASSSQTVTVDYATVAETAHEDTDYEPVQGSLTFLPGESARTVAVTLVDDDVHEGDETFALHLSMAENAVVSTASATGTVVDDDAAPELAITDETAPEGGTIGFTVTLTGSTSRTATVDYATTGGTAHEDADYVPVQGTLTFLPGESASTVAVTLVDDDVHEGDETFALHLSMAENAAVSTASATGTIVDDDAAPELAIAGGTALEGGTIAFTVTLTGSTSRTTTVDYATADGTAITGDDYAPTSGTLTFVPGDTVATFAVSIADDEEYEPEESFEAVLSSPVHATLATRSATGTILDDDEKPATLSARPADPMLCVGGDPVEIDLARHFDGTSLRYSAASADTSVAIVELRGSVLTVAPVGEGQATLILSAANGSGEASIELTATVVTDPAELAAIEGAFARAWSGLLAEIVSGIGDRFVNPGATASAARPATVAATPTRPDRGAFAGGGTTRGWDRSAAFGGGTTALQMPDAGSDTPARPRSGAFSLSTGTEGGSGDWSVWGRGSVRRHESRGVLDLDGSLETLQIGADRRISDWILGASAAVSRADTNFRFVRSADVCGGGGTGEGVLETELASVHPYAGRKVGGGWVWATLGFGRGEAVLKRCVSGRRTTADVSVRMGALGARHRVDTGGRLELSLVEDIGVLRATTGAAVGPVADLSVSVGRARIGVEVATVPAPRPAMVVVWARTLARHDWGDAVEGTGLDVAAGARLRIPCRRFALDASVHALAVHSADDHEERGADIAASVLPRDDGSGVQLTLALRRGARSDLDRGTGDWLHDPRWPRSDVGWRRDAYLGYGIVVRRALVQPFASVGTANGDRRSQRVGLRIDLIDGQRRLGTEISVGREERWPDAGGFVLIRFDARI